MADASRRLSARPLPSAPPRAGRRSAATDAARRLRCCCATRSRGTFAFNRTSLAGHLDRRDRHRARLRRCGAARCCAPLGRGVRRRLAACASGCALRFARAEPTHASPALRRACASGSVGVLVAGALWGAAGWLFYGLRQRRRSQTRADPRRLHLLRRLRAGPGDAVPRSSSLFVLLVLRADDRCASRCVEATLQLAARRRAAGGRWRMTMLLGRSYRAVVRQRRSP